MSALLEAALKRARTGACVLPLWWTDDAGRCQCPAGSECPSPGKHPLLKRGLHDASRDEGDIIGWWRRWPKANVGVRTDRRPRVDIDLVEVAEALVGDVALAAETEIVRTPRGGLHIALVTSVPVRGGSLYLSDGRKLGDLKAANGYVLVPPSKIGGNQYELVSPEHGHVKAEDEPHLWLARILPAFGFELREGRGGVEQGYMALAGTIHDGEGRHNALISYAGRIWVDGMGADTLAALLREVNSRQCRPPLDEDEVVEIAGHFIAKRERRIQADGSARDRSRGRYRIIVSNRHLHEIAADAWDVLTAQNEPPMYFRHAGSIAEVDDDEFGSSIVHLSLARLRGRVDRMAEWVRLTKEGPKPARPPKDVVEDMEALPRRLPPLRGITGTPTFSADAALVVEPGYQESTQLYYAPVGEPVPAVPPVPDSTDLKRAKQIIGQEWLADFPFMDEASRAHAIAAPLTAIVRELIDGPTPLLAIDAPAAGTGKGLLAGGIGLIVSGLSPAVMTEERDDEELRKRITAILSAGRPIAVFDNVRRRLVSGVLAALLTATIWSDRLLGKNETVDLPNRTMWLVTGNNLQLNDEIARRTVWIRIDARVDRPWQRTSFRHPDLMGWLGRHRHELVWALLVLTQNWIARGRPTWSGRTFGSYESWSSVVGGITEAAGIEGFLANREELYRRADAETEEWRAFVAAWWEEHGSRAVKAADLIALALHEDLLPSVFASAKEDANERALRTRLGKALSQRRDRRFADIFIRGLGQDSHRKGALYRLEEANTPEVEAQPSASSADVPHEDGAMSDTNAEGAEDAEPVSNARARELEGNEINTSTAKNVPQHPLVPQTDTDQAGSGAEDVRKMGLDLRDVPQPFKGCGC